MKQMIITGAGGFLGTEIISQCIENGEYEIYALTSKPEELTEKYRDCPRFHLYGGEILEDAYVVHCAFPRKEDGRELAAGLDYSKKCYRLLKKIAPRGIVHVSSQSVYSRKREKPASESTPVNLESGYAAGKYAAELLTNTFFEEIPHTNLRMASLIGVGFEQRITNIFVEQALKNHEIHIQEGQQSFGFLDVRDAAAAVVRLLEDDSPKEWKEVYNVGTDENHTLREIAETVIGNVEEYCGIEAVLTSEESDVCFQSTLNSERFRRQFYWEPKYNLKDTVISLIRAKGEPEKSPCAG